MIGTTKGRVAAAALMAMLLAAGCQKAPATRASGTVDDARLAQAHQDGANWLLVGGGRDEQHYSVLDKINTTNVAELKPAWSADFDTTRGQESEAIVVDGTMYVTTAWSKLYAYNAATGEQLWMFDPKVDGAAGPKGCCDVVNRGPAYYKGKVYVGTYDGRLVAVDAKTGAKVWDINTIPEGERHRSYTITGAPRVVKDKVLIGNAGAEYDVRGFVSAFDAATGKLAWRFYVVPGKPGTKDNAASDEALAKYADKTWFGNWWDKGGGGAPWDAIVYDREMDRIYIGGGNGTPHSHFKRSEGKGDNLFLSSIIAVDANTGKYIWHYQVNPGDSWDFTATQPIMLADLKIGGQVKKVLMQAPKNGFFYVIDRQTGVPISADAYVPGITWASGVDPKTWRPIENPDARYINKPFLSRPSVAGAHNWQPMAFSPKTGLVYIPTSENNWVFQANNPDNDHAQVDMAALQAGMPKPQVYLQAWDPVARKQVWKADASGGRLDLGGGGVLATAGDLVFQGRGELVGELVAMAADTGKVLWRHATPNAIMAAPITYTVNGEQYVAVATGAGGPVIFGSNNPARERQVGRMVAFKIGGTATLPPEPPLAGPAAPPNETFTAAQVEEGKKLYGQCANCHGAMPRNSNIIPDLRRSGVLSSKETWKMVLIDGILTDRGMISFKARGLDEAKAESIRAYVASEARKLQAEQAKGVTPKPVGAAPTVPPAG